MQMLAANPFLNSFLQADWMGKGIFFSLLAVSITCWSILLYKICITRQSRKLCEEFKKIFSNYRNNPLTIELTPEKKGLSNPLQEIYMVAKKQTLGILHKNKTYAKNEGNTSYLSPTDIEFVETHIDTIIATEVQKLDQNLYILSTITTLAPFLGLLGTVWGILTTFSHLEGHVTGSANQMMLGGLSLALTTTVLGLIIAIPALIGFNYLKNKVKELHTEMENFSNEVMAAVELQYRQVDIK